MAKMYTATIGPIVAKAAGIRAADELALSRASHALCVMDRARPFLVFACGRFSIVSASIREDGSVGWWYSSPRGVGEFSPHPTDALGYAGSNGEYPDQLEARSAALSHCISYDGPVPDEAEWPVGMNARDIERLRSLREAQVRAAA